MNDKYPSYLEGNVQGWQRKAADYVAAAERAWASDHPYWGIWEIPEGEAGLLPVDMAGMAAIELGCGTAYVSAWMRRRGARVVAIDTFCRLVGATPESFPPPQPGSPVANSIPFNFPFYNFSAPITRLTVFVYYVYH